MDIDLAITLGGLIVGFTVGLTGMGGGALMTPMLVLLFGVDPLAAVSSDLVASMVMKPVGGSVHLRRGTVHRGIVAWLVAGSVPAAFCGVLILQALGDGAGATIEVLLGSALLAASAAMIVRGAMAPRDTDPAGDPRTVPVRRVATLAVGIVGGLVVGLTSVGSGSLMIVSMVALYPMLSTRVLVGTDLVQAVPLVASAAVGHLLFGDVRLGSDHLAVDRCAARRVRRRPSLVAGRRPVDPADPCRRAGRQRPQAARRGYGRGRGRRSRRRWDRGDDRAGG